VVISRGGRRGGKRKTDRQTDRQTDRVRQRGGIREYETKTKKDNIVAAKHRQEIK
jgi:5-methylcytosine-specific restriction endonuclease McrA